MTHHHIHIPHTFHNQVHHNLHQHSHHNHDDRKHDPPGALLPALIPLQSTPTPVMSKVKEHREGGGKSRGVEETIFQGVASYTPEPAPAIGLPQPLPPPGAASAGLPVVVPPNAVGYQPQAVTGYAVEEGRPVRKRRLPCCGIGVGWFLFIIGFFLAGIPWYAGAIMLFCSSNLDYREKPGYIGCTIAAIVEIAAIAVGVMKAIHH
ncbi:hypothetical protein Drorol1_Dr00027911 [Drosera rotundifolia]